MHILLVEGDATIRRSAARLLRRDGVLVDECGDALDALRSPRSGAYDAIVLDIAPPYEDFATLPEKLRANGSVAPVLVLATRDARNGRYAELLAGTDMLIRPFKYAELLSRLRAIVQNYASSTAGVLRCGNIRINTIARGVYINGSAIQLLAREYDILLALLRNAGRALTVAQLQSETGPGGAGGVDAGIRSLRRKLGAAGDSIVTVRGRGYMLDMQRQR